MSGALFPDDLDVRVAQQRLAADDGHLVDEVDLPALQRVSGRPHLIVPYSFDNNDSRMNRAQGFETGDDFFRYCRDSFDWLYRSGQEGRPRMMSVGLHARIVGRPGRIGALARLIDHLQGREGVWIASREVIARHWRARFPAPGEG